MEVVNWKGELLARGRTAEIRLRVLLGIVRGQEGGVQV